MAGAARRGSPDHNISIEEIVDKYLNPHDRPFTVPEIFESLEAAGLSFAGFRHPLWYDPAAVLPKADLGESLQRTPLRERAALGELIHGAYHSRHVFFASRRIPAPVTPRPNDWDNVPVWIGNDVPVSGELIMFDEPIPSWISGVALTLLRGIDGNRSISELCRLFVKDGVFRSDEDFRAAWDRLYRLLNGRGLLMLKAVDE